MTNFAPFEKLLLSMKEQPQTRSMYPSKLILKTVFLNKCWYNAFQVFGRTTAKKNSNLKTPFPIRIRMLYASVWLRQK